MLSQSIGKLIDYGITRPARQRRASKGTPLKRAENLLARFSGVSFIARR
jgi:hypothetical protein